ncbi:biotin--[acetyl-CoA-carboxylase] ligase [Convivina intestini]|uniref:Bifunctional ligase/repressor BirA n=1 Tax=Convivina intestini TaxID=1505726 RepID=A0A2U1DEK2_9LACO|nr:biotin--[acetyl-CoA-carboxylase] ligase [Convivina intestini]PVY86113.1 BirA family biotin operon repressor/biotin-[acetyl-CoA-carboxylase] ligase [Convivina intestini]CAH1851458.1 Bifunctional ligase/repressor BirA [Convivina intestini]SDB80864.1 BirA family transcriptional regulator, biotin operon repressor / biotin-[acetyl-CoA-carboxylase] ligase [Leuconostocaceae bacterium R-53105]
MVESTKNLVLAEFLQHPQEWLSGDLLANQLGISRESVWKAIRSLKASGHQIESKKKSGYCYQGSLKLDPQVVANYQQIKPAVKVLCFDEVASTQINAKDYISKNTIDAPVAITAEGQFGGYGRQGRHFVSPSGRGIYVSLILPVKDSKLEPGLLTTSAAIAAIRALSSFFPNKDFQVKWVNDLLLNNHKIGGIITEATMDLESQHYSAVIIGLGLNLLPVDFPAEIRAKAGSVMDESDPAVDRNVILAKILDELVLMSTNYQNGDYLDEYREKLILTNQEVTVQVGSEFINGRVTGIDDQGSLLLINEQGQAETIYSGEVTKIKLLSNLNL